MKDDAGRLEEEGKLDTEPRLAHSRTRVRKLLCPERATDVLLPDWASSRRAG